MWSTERAVRVLAAATCAGMLLVLVMGAAVTNTGSAEGCGRSWPLCNGQFVPEFTVATAIEYSHRAVTGIESILVIALTASMLARWWRSVEARALAGLMLSTLFLQAGLGAGAVLWPQAPLMLATHFGVSLIAFASTYLSAVFVFEHTSLTLVSWRAAPEGFRWWTVGTVVYVLGVVYLGAYVRHAGVSLACVDWPLCNGQVVPPLDGATGVVFAHRVAALGAVVLLCLLMVRSRSVGIAGAQATAAFVASVLQALSGALLVWTDLGLFSTLLHAAIMGLLFAALASVLERAIRHPERNDSAADVYLLSDGAARQMQPIGSAFDPHAQATPSADVSTAARRSAVVDHVGGERTVAGRAQRSSSDG